MAYFLDVSNGRERFSSAEGPFRANHQLKTTVWAVYDEESELVNLDNRTP